MNIVCVGDCGIDRYLPSGETYFGGITANFARHAKREFPDGDRITIISAVGNDDGGDLVLSSLENSGIDFFITRLNGATPIQSIEILPDGEKNFVRYDEGVLREFRFDEESKKRISESELLVAPVYLQIVGLFDALMAIPTAGMTSIDFADFLQYPDFELLERHLESIDVGFFGLSANDAKTIDRIQSIARRHDKLFVITLGSRGSRAYQGDKRFDCAPVRVDRVLDTTGAGDAFAAAFLSRFCHGQSVPDALTAGARLAADVIQRRGSM